MGIRRLLRGTAVCAVALCALPATASAATRKGTGQTSQHKHALVWVRDDGSVSLVRLGFKAPCRAPGYTIASRMYFRDIEPGRFVRDGARFSDDGKFTKRFPDRTKLVATVAMSGGPSADGGFEGTFRAQLRYYDRRGRFEDFCKTPAITWKVGPPA
jgi:hypothetical protein